MAMNFVKSPEFRKSLEDTVISKQNTFQYLVTDGISYLPLKVYVCRGAQSIELFLETDGNCHLFPKREEVVFIARGKIA